MTCCSHQEQGRRPTCCVQLKIIVRVGGQVLRVGEQKKEKYSNLGPKNNMFAPLFSQHVCEPNHMHTRSVALHDRHVTYTEKHLGQFIDN